MFRLLGTLVLASLLAACGGGLQSIKVAQVPPQIVGKQISISSERAAKDDVASRAYEVPGNSIFFQQFSGGSVSVGVLLGPIGVMANVANIDRITRNMGESGKDSGLYQFDAQQEAKTALNEQLAQLKIEPGIQSVALKPFVTYSIMDEKIGINTLVSVRAEAKHGPEGKDKWVGTYTLILDKTMPVDALKQKMSAEEIDGLKAQIRKAYSEIFNEIRVDLTPGPLPKREVAWVLSNLGAGGPGDVGRNSAGHMVLRSAWGNNIYNCIIYANDKQYSFQEPPVARDKK